MGRALKGGNTARVGRATVSTSPVALAGNSRRSDSDVSNGSENEPATAVECGEAHALWAIAARRTGRDIASLRLFKAGGLRQGGAKRSPCRAT
jgi:hypothetical protein